MSGFDPTWLALREPYDHGARDRSLTEAFVNALGPSPELIDLGCGTGSNLRYLAPHLPAAQRWTCIDHDPLLLRHLEETKPIGIDVATKPLDLSQGLDELPIQAGTAVTAQALLDLASAAWLDRLAESCQEAAVLMTLSFDGRMVWAPADAEDEAINAAFGRHQRSDKGFGPALGPDAASHLGKRLREMGHEVRLGNSDWVFCGDDGPILRAMVEGVSAAAEEADPNLDLEAWRLRRFGEIEAEALSLIVGHLDLLALPRPA